MSRALLTLLLLLPLLAQARPPRLTLWITVDGLSSDVLQRNRVHYKAGLAQLLSQGAYFPTSRYAYAEPGTAAGHSTLATGANPWRHGVIANGVFDRNTGKEVPVFADARYPVLGAPIGVEDASPLALKSESIGDRLRMSSQDRSRVVAIAGKARAAIPFAGRGGQAWWFSDAGSFVTGTWYLKDFPQWARTFNERKPAEAMFGKAWGLSLPAKSYVGADDRSYEAEYLGLGRTFPHPTTAGLSAPGPQSNAALSFTPAIDELLVSFARAAIAGEKLGADEHADLLSVSFSGFDRVQHLFGPYSWEVQDTLVKLDRVLLELISAAERAAGGRSNLLIVFSADHGSAAIPEEWAEQGQPGTRVNPKTLAASVEKELRSKFGQELTVNLDETDLYLSGKSLQGKDVTAIRREAATILGAQKEVALAVAREDLATVQDLGNLAPALRKGFFPERSGDVAFVLKPFHVLNDHSSGTSHGTPWRYDTDVPVIFAGKGIRAGTYGEIIDPTDLSPTVATVLEIGIPASAEGSVRHEALTGK